jgi:hypothetical protein
LGPRDPGEIVGPRPLSDVGARPLNFTVRAHVNARNGFHVVVTITPVLAFLSGCAATSPHALSKYQPPPTGAPAAVIDVGKHAQAWSIDGAETPSFATTLRLAPGEHRVGINCQSWEILSRDPVTPIIFPTVTAQFVLITGPFEAGKTYYARCVATNGQPRAWLADAPAGADLPQGFTAVCTRQCPR